MKKEKQKMRYFICCVMLLLFSTAPAWSADQPKITVQLTAQRVMKNAQGQEIFAPGDVAKPGEIIEYRIEYKNKGKGVARNLQGGLPIPAGMEFVPGSAVPADVSASLDGKIFSKIPLHRKVKLADGSVVTREVPAAEYVSLRWLFPELAPGASKSAKARMRLRNDQNGPLTIKIDKNT